MLEDTLKKELLARAKALETEAGVLCSLAEREEAAALEKRVLADKMRVRANESRYLGESIPDWNDAIPF